MTCKYCGALSHPGVCPTVKALEYFPDGSVKRVEFKTAADFPPLPYAPSPPAPGLQPVTPFRPVATSWARPKSQDAPSASWMTA